MCTRPLYLWKELMNSFLTAEKCFYVDICAPVNAWLTQNSDQCVRKLDLG